MCLCHSNHLQFSLNSCISTKNDSSVTLIQTCTWFPYYTFHVPHHCPWLCLMLTEGNTVFKWNSFFSGRNFYRFSVQFSHFQLALTIITPYHQHWKRLIWFLWVKWSTTKSSRSDTIFLIPYSLVLREICIRLRGYFISFIFKVSYAHVLMQHVETLFLYTDKSTVILILTRTESKNKQNVEPALKNHE